MQHMIAIALIIKTRSIIIKFSTYGTVSPQAGGALLKGPWIESIQAICKRNSFHLSGE